MVVGGGAEVVELVAGLAGDAALVGGAAGGGVVGGVVVVGAVVGAVVGGVVVVDAVVGTVVVGAVVVGGAFRYGLECIGLNTLSSEEALPSDGFAIVCLSIVHEGTARTALATPTMDSRLGDNKSVARLCDCFF